MFSPSIQRLDHAGQQKKKRLQRKIDALHVLGDIESDSTSSSDDELTNNSITTIGNTNENLLDFNHQLPHEAQEKSRVNLNAIQYVPDNDDHGCNDDPIDSSFDSSPYLYKNCPISVKTAATTIISIAIEFNFPKIAIERILKAFKSFLPMPNTLPTTQKSLFKAIGVKSTSATKYHCNSCRQLCSIRSGRKYCDNPSCEFKNRSLRNGQVSEIVTMDVKEQLKSIIGRNISLFNNPECFPPFDIRSRSVYNKLSSSTSNCSQTISDQIHPITLNIHTDGAPMIRTTKSALWPCLASIVELPPYVRERQTNIVILCLWLSSMKPDVDIFLKDCIEQLMELSSPFILIVNNVQFRLTIRTQLFVSDLPAKALFWKTINYNGYNACSYCTTEGACQERQVFYPYSKNNYQKRTHDEFVATARIVEDRLPKRRTGGSINGIKGLSPLLRVFEYPKQIILDYMHLCCLGHMSTLIHRWLSIMDKNSIADINSQLFSQRFPHNMSVKFNYPLNLAGDWKAKHFRVFVLSIGVGLMLKHLPPMIMSHFALYSMFIKLLHCPKSIEEVTLADEIIHYYCKTAKHIYGQSIELFSLHAHLHLPQQVLDHGGLSFTSAFCFESSIRYLKKKAHGTRDLATQISDWIDIERTINKQPLQILKSSGVNRIHINSRIFNDYREVFRKQIKSLNESENDIILFLRYKNTLTTYHSLLYDIPYTCVSYIVSYEAADGSIEYGQMIVFFKLREDYYVLIRQYTSTNKNISDFLSIPTKFNDKINEIFPIRTLTNLYTIVSVNSIRFRCIQVESSDLLFLSEVRVDYEHD